ncbi:MAG TPA: LysE family translocator [Cellvibrionaceae bacterium]|nr:LysE family translocator [Cellvibrionaceae bacterium]HMY40818.1 LysE family translocator [Marinagarivorans sp.]
MPLDSLLQFILITGAVSISPGPVMLLCLALGSRLPLARVSAAMLGASLGNCVLMVLSAAGLGSLVALWPKAFGAIALAGGLYLFYLGVMLWRAPWVDLSSAAQPQLNSYGALLQRGFWVAASNPKGIVYFGALIPPFLQHSHHYTLTAIMLTGIFLAIDLAVMLAYAKLGRQLTQLLKLPSTQRRCNQILASFLMLMAVWLCADTIHTF